MSIRLEQAWSVLPRGNSLDDGVWRRRHRLLLGVLLLHVPALLVLGFVRGLEASHTLIEVAPLLVTAGVGAVGRSRLLRSLVVTLGLLYAGLIAVHFTDGLIEAHFHYFLLLGFVALYQDWRPLLLAVTFIVVGHGSLGVIAPRAVYNHPAAINNPWLWAIIHGAFYLAASAMFVVFWKQSERQQSEAARYYHELVEGERAMVAQLRDAQALKDELVSVVGHEFRTPLASIMGFAQTLSARLDDMDREGARRSARAIERQAKRLTRMVANLLTASSDLVPAPDDATDLLTTVGDAVDDVLELAPATAKDVQVNVAEGHRVVMSSSAAYQVLFNLLDNALKFADHQTNITIATRRDGDSVVLEVTNVGPPIPESDRERIFDAFVQADSSETRRYGGIGLGLHIVRKITETHGGRVGVYCEGPVVIFRVWLPAADVQVATSANSG
ncbi:MAG: sensor histidine kinase [Egibacteraceae bacterium]